MFFSLSIGSLILNFFLLLVGYKFYKIIIQPYLLIRYYRKQGIDATFVPLLGYLKAAFTNIHKHGDFYYDWKQRPYQNLKSKDFAVNLGNNVILWLVEPEHVKTFFNNQEPYSRKPEILVFFDEFLGDGLLFLKSPDMKRHRKLVSSAFNYEFLKNTTPLVLTTADELLDKFKEKDMNRIDFINEIQVITGEIVGKTFFGESFSDHRFNGVELTRALSDLLAQITQATLDGSVALVGGQAARMGVLPNHKKLMRNIKEFKAYILNLVNQKFRQIALQREKGLKSYDSDANLLQIFYDQRLQSPAEAFTDEEVVSEFITFFLAGMDTTGHLLTFATYFFLKHPECQEKLMKEANNLCTDPSKLTLDEINQMDYMTAFIKECLRVTPPATILFHRTAMEDHNIGSIKVKKGTEVNIALIINNFSPEYHQNPNDFLPNRWIDEDSQTRKSVLKYPHIYTPFSSGSRNCIGQHLAMNEARILFSLFLKKFDFELSDKDYKLNLVAKFTYEPNELIHYRIRPKAQ